jgi:hypothetical protein
MTPDSRLVAKSRVDQSVFPFPNFIAADRSLGGRVIDDGCAGLR